LSDIIQTDLHLYDGATQWGGQCRERGKLLFSPVYESPANVHSSDGPHVEPTLTLPGGIRIAAAKSATVTSCRSHRMIHKHTTRSSPTLLKPNQGSNLAIAVSSAKLTALAGQFEKLRENKTASKSTISICQPEFEHQARRLGPGESVSLTLQELWSQVTNVRPLIFLVSERNRAHRSPLWVKSNLTHRTSAHASLFDEPREIPSQNSLHSNQQHCVLVHRPQKKSYKVCGRSSSAGARGPASRGASRSLPCKSLVRGADHFRTCSVIYDHHERD
jgi:hypothetical protein